MESPYITDPNHGGKITCQGCGAFIKEDAKVLAYSAPDSTTVYHFHSGCFQDPLVDRDCAALDGHCGCPPNNPRGGIPNSCKYLQNKV